MIGADWRDERGKPATTADRLGKEALDPFGIQIAICNCLYGVQAAFSEDLGAAMARAVNDWIAREWLDRDPRLRASIVVPQQNAELAVAASDGQSHPVIGLWSVALREQLRHALVVEDIRKIDRWTARYRLATVTWPIRPIDPFFNANTMDDIAEADRLAALDGG